MNVSLSPELEEYIDEKVRSGRYTSPSEVVSEALRMMGEHEKVRAEQLQEFRAGLDRRVAALQRGGSVDGEAVFERLNAKSTERRKPGA